MFIIDPRTVRAIDHDRRLAADQARRMAAVATMTGRSNRGTTGVVARVGKLLNAVSDAVLQRSEPRRHRRIGQPS